MDRSSGDGSRRLDDATWTQPYCGVQHLNGLPRGWQISVQDYETFANVFVLGPGGGFTSLAEADCDDVQAARVWGERQAQLLIGKGAL